MRSIKRNIIIVLVAAIALASCAREARVIPRKTMTKIFVDMFMADAWLGIQPQEVLKESDTTAFYEPIFNKYGFTLADYLKSVDYYLNEPERFTKMVSKSTAILKARQEELEQMLDPAELPENGADSLSDPGSDPKKAAGRKKARKVRESADTLEEEAL